MRAFINKNEKEEEENAGELLKSLRDSAAIYGLKSRGILGIREDEEDFEESGNSSRVKKLKKSESIKKN